MVDVVQVIGKGLDDLVFFEWVDFVIFFGYKFYVFCGIGFIYKWVGCKLVLLIDGGG